MKKTLLLFLFLLCVRLLNAQYVSFKRFTTDNGLADQFVYSINQNKNGYLYVGSGNGLSVFGGYAFRNYTARDGLAFNFVTTTFEDNKSTTWIGHFQNGISYYTNGHFGHLANTMLSTVRINKIVGDEKNNVYALSSGLGIVQLIDTLTEKKLDINDEIIFDAHIYKDYYYIATPDGLKLYLYKDGKYKQVELPPVFGKGECVRIVKSTTADDEYFCSIADVGILWFKVNRETIHIIRTFTSKELKSAAPVKDFVIDRSNNIWVSCFDDGIRRLNCKNNNLHYYLNTTVINTNNGLPTNNIERLFVDNQKNIWLGTYGEGLLQYVNEIFIEHRISEGESYLSISADRRDNIIIVTNEGLFKTTDSTSTQNLTPLILNSAQGRKIKYVTIANDTMFVSGEKRNSLFIFDIKSGRIKNETVFPNSTNTEVNHIFSKNHLLYISTNKGLYVYTTTLKFVNFFNHENGLLHDFIFSSFFDSKNRLWLASHGTKPYWLDVKTGKITYFNDIQGMNLFNMNGYEEDSEGNIWLATEGDGLFKYNNKHFTKYSTSEGLLSNFCYGINKDLKNNIWVGHNYGVTKITPEGKFVLFSTGTQLKNLKLIKNGVIRDQSGYLWFIGDKSIFKHAIQNEQPNTVAPSVVYLGMTVDDVFYPAGKTNVDLPYGKHDIKFKFICISLTDPDKVMVEHKLEGHEDQWSSTSSDDEEISYASLSSGNFKFKIVAKNEDGFSSAETTLVSINIDSPIWLKWWFILICVALIVVLIFLFIRFRTNQLIKNKRELEQKIHEQTIEIRGEKEYITKINKELTQVYKDLRDSINYAKNIQTSILPNFDELKNKLRIYSYLDAKDVVGGDFYGFYELPNKNQIVFLVDCTGHGVPGGFLTVIAKALLDKIVLQMKVTDCAEIIQNLNIEFRLFFGSDSQRSNVRFEGLVISLCHIDYREKTMKICAAGTSVYYTRDKEIIRFRGNRDSVGYEERLENLEILQIPLEKKSRVYMFSDGLQDQFGGPFFKRYSTKKLIASVDRTLHLPLEQQGEEMIKAWLAWKGTEAQIDDVAFIALEVI
jgi:ligand-binding sensor domain-containing protein/serine phosphatase RsbU (regulator of sigma subunit)